MSEGEASKIPQGIVLADPSGRKKVPINVQYTTEKLKQAVSNSSLSRSVSLRVTILHMITRLEETKACLERGDPVAGIHGRLYTVEAAGIAKLPIAMKFLKDKTGSEMDPNKLSVDDVYVLSKTLGVYLPSRRGPVVTGGAQQSSGENVTLKNVAGHELHAVFRVRSLGCSLGRGRNRSTNEREPRCDGGSSDRACA